MRTKVSQREPKEMPREHPHRRAVQAMLDKRWIAVIATAVTLLYIVTWPANRTEAEDGYSYALTVENGVDLVNPRHLLFKPLMRVAFVAVRFVRPSARAYDVMAAASLVAAVATVCLVAWFVHREFRQPKLVAAAGGLLLAVSYGFWRYATEAEIYALASFLAVVTVVVAVTFANRSTGLLASALIGSLAVLVHTANAVPILLCIPLALVGRSVRAAGTYVAGVLGTLAIAAPLSVLTLDSERLSSVSDRAAGGLDVLTPIRGLVGAGQVVMSGNFLFSYDGFRRLMTSVFPLRSFAEEAYAGEHAPALTRLASPVTALAVVVVVLVIAHLAWNHRVRGARLRRTSVTSSGGAILVWLVSMAALATVVSAGNPEGWLLALPPLAIAVSVWVLPRASVRWAALPLVLPAVLAFHNLVGGLLIIMPESGDYNRARSEWIVNETIDGDVVLTATSPVTERYLRYYSAADIKTAYALTQPELRASLSATSTNGRVFVTGDVLDPPTWLARAHPADVETMTTFARQIERRLRVAHRDDAQVIYRYLSE